MRRRLVWLSILFSVAALTFAGHLVREEQRESDDTATLVVLTLQAKVLTAASMLSPPSVTRELPKLDRLAATPAVARALAALNAFAGGDEGIVRARTLLDRHADELDDPEQQQLHDTVRRAIDDAAALDEADRERVRSAMGWFGKLLLARGRSETDPLRREVARSALTTFLATIVLLGAGGAATLAGAALLLLALLRRSSPSLRPRLEPRGADSTLYLEAFAVYIGLILLFDAAAAVVGLEHPAIGLAGIVLGSLLGLFWPVLRGVPAGAARRELGLHRGEGWGREAACGLVGYLAILPVLAVGVVLSLILMTVPELISPPGPDEPPRLVSHPALVWMAHGGVAVRLAVLFLAAAFAPLFEEALFRGALYRALRDRRGAVSSALVMAFLFAVIHPQGFAVVPALMSLAFGFAMLREWRGSLIAPMVAHAVHNGTLVGFMWLAFG